MNRIALISDIDTGHGFGLTGIDVYSTNDPREAERLLAGFMKSREYAVVAYSEEYIDDLGAALRRKIEESVTPVFIAVPSVRSWKEGAGVEDEYLEDLLKRSIGFYVAIKK